MKICKKQKSFRIKTKGKTIKGNEDFLGGDIKIKSRKISKNQRKKDYNEDLRDFGKK